MKFDFIIGNPPYQEEVENNDRMNPIYNLFMDESYKLSDCVLLITLGRFLFNAGQTPKNWNEKMLNDEHFKVIHYEADATKIFPGIIIKGGIAITIHNNNICYGKIESFTPYPLLNSIFQKVKMYPKTNQFLDSIVSSRGLYRLTDAYFTTYPNASKAVGDGTGNMIVSNIFEKNTDAFINNLPTKSSNEYYKIIGRSNNNRVYKYILSKYVIMNEYIPCYKLFFPEANGSGIFGETLTLPEIGKPFECATDTFINIGKLSSEYEAISLSKYIKTKFLRALLSIKKATQHSSKSVWSTIPLQNFTNKSDIIWDLPINEIDKQLYKKYGLTEEEINFIETNVKEMK